ncbi:MAG TPA: histone deacetylase [Solirubrobacterales bacterium]|nr:histone deacetylase [Solirubrobacterales bacterium]
MGLYLRHPASLAHDTGPHPENAERVRAIEAALADREWLGLELVEAPAATRDQLVRVHTPEHVGRIEEFCRNGGGMIDMDTVAVEASYEAALRAAGGALEAVERMLGGEERLAFCGLRPPGHHAETARAMGFCLFNNVAVAVAHAIEECGAERVLVLDWDVHHGNGTAEIFSASDRVVYTSIHQSPLYPGTGDADDLGTGAGEGYTVNLPVPPGADSDDFLSLVQNVVVPVAREHRPGLIAISAGYDAHRADPLAQCMVDTAAYADMAASTRDVAAELDAPVLVCLEGGYELDALAASVVATIGALADSYQPRAAPPEPAERYLDRVRSYWPRI